MNFPEDYVESAVMLGDSRWTRRFEPVAGHGHQNMTTSLGWKVTGLGAMYGAIASLAFPTLWSVAVILQPSSEAIRFLASLWLVTLPGAVAAGVVMGHLVVRRYVRHAVAAGAVALGLAVINAGLGGVLNSVTGNPVGLGGGFAAHGGITGGFIGGAWGFVLFFPVTVPLALVVGILIRDRVLLLCDHSRGDS